MTSTSAPSHVAANVIALRGPRPGKLGHDAPEHHELLFRATAAALGGLLGLSPFLNGFYDFSTWGVASFIAAGLLAAFALLGSPPRSLPARVALAAICGLAAWAALSMLWSESVDRAWTEANRISFYAVLLGLTCVLVRDRRTGATLLVAMALGTGVTLLSVLGELLATGGQEMFVDFRLQDPVGYVNGEAGFLLVALWAFAGLGESSTSAWARGTAAGCAVLAACFLVLTQSRSVVPAVIASVVVVLCLFPRRTRRVWLLASVFGPAALALPWLLEVHGERAGTDALHPSREVVLNAGLAALAAAVVGAVAWGVGSSIARRAVRPGIAKAATAGAALVVCSAVFVPFLLTGNPISTVSSAYEDFTSLAAEPVGGTRFTSGGGYRSDLWRVAVRQFEANPFTGVGAGNFTSTYYLQRRTLQEARQPHSLPLQVLGELGVPGFILLIVLAGAVAVATWRARQATDRAWIGVAATGISAAWLIHTSVDWLHYLPGVAGMAVVAGGVLISTAEPSVTDRLNGRHERGHLAVTILLVIALATIVASTGRQFLAHLYLRDGQDSLMRDPVDALNDARRARALNAQSVEIYYLESAAWARLGAFAEADAALRSAVRLEPDNYVSWALRGDVHSRRARWTKARSFYARASALNPRDPDLRLLANDPRASVR